MRRVEAGTLSSPDDVKTAIDALLPNQRNGGPDYIQSGADNTLRGVAVFNALRNASPENPLSQAWTNVVANPLVGPVAAHQPNPANPDSSTTRCARCSSALKHRSASFMRWIVVERCLKVIRNQPTEGRRRLLRGGR